MTPSISNLCCLSFIVFVLFSSLKSLPVTFSNLKPRLDTNGQIVDGHDGGAVIKFNGLFYLFSTQYGLCKEPTGYGCDQTTDHCGFREDHNISIYISPTMESGTWYYYGSAIDVDKRPPGVLYRPHVVWNPNTQQFVLLWNYSEKYAAATSLTLTQPFVLQTAEVNLTRAPETTGDFDIMVDDDGTAYIIYMSNFYISIEKLSKDFLSGTGEVSQIFPDYFVESPVMFKRNNIYYALFGHCCCFCLQGSGIIVYIAKNPLGPWKLQPGGDLACRNSTSEVGKDLLSENHESTEKRSKVNKRKAIPTPGQGCLYTNPKSYSITKSQQNSVIQVETSSGLAYVWTGDRWQQAPDGIKGHEPQYWYPLSFDNQGFIQTVEWTDEFTLDIV